MAVADAASDGITLRVALGGGDDEGEDDGVADAAAEPVAEIEEVADEEGVGVSDALGEPVKESEEIADEEDDGVIDVLGEDEGLTGYTIMRYTPQDAHELKESGHVTVATPAQGANG